MDIMKENENSPQYPNNVQRTIYEIAISHTKERIKRIQNRNNELAKLSEQTKRDIASIDVKTSDQIAQLNRLLFAELIKINDYHSAIDVINRKRAEEKKETDCAINSSNKVYQDTQFEMLSKMKFLNAKINALEDFKHKRIILENKLTINDEIMTQKEQELEKRLFQIDIKFKVDREKLIENLRKQLFELSTSWISDMRKRETVTVRRLFQENISIRYELDQNALEIYDNKHYYSTSKSLKNLSQRSCILRHADTTKSLIAMKSQYVLIKLLKKNLQKQKNHPDNALPLAKKVFINYDTLIDKLQSDILRSEVEIASLKNNLYNINFKFHNTKILKNHTEEKINKYINTLYDIKYIIACALQIFHCGPEIASMTEIQFISYLKNLVNNK